MIAKLFKYWRKSKEQKAVEYALNLMNILNELDRQPAKDGDAAVIYFYEFSHTDQLNIDYNHGQDQKSIKFTHKGEILK